MKKVFEVDEVCTDCNGTGLYVGMAERDGAAVVCHSCKGSGRYHFKHEYEVFERRSERYEIKRVYQANPGICIGAGNGYKLEDFGGMPYKEWVQGFEFKIGMENRNHTCPAQYYQSANYKLKPDWDECGFGMFSACEHFKNKSECWKRFDIENNGGVK